MTRFHKLAYCAGVSAAALVASPAFAQSQSSGQAANQGASLREIVVTAQRREEKLQDVPIAVTALDTITMQQKQVFDVFSLNRVAPGVQIKPSFNPNELNVSIRGVAQLATSINSDPPTGIYVDGVYTVMNAGSNTGMIDMERVEVLHGPQGTLFGRNTVGGAISITTKKPTDQFEGYLQGDAGNYGTWQGLGVVNIPIVPGVIDTRFVYQHNEVGGYGRNFFLGNKTSKTHSDYFRGTADIKLGSDWDLIVSGNYDDAHGTTAPTKMRYWDSTSPLIALVPSLSRALGYYAAPPGDLLTNYIGNPSDLQDTISSTKNGFDLKSTNLMATLTGHLSDSVTIKSISGFNSLIYETQSDLDGTPYQLLELMHYPIRAKQWSEELQLLGNSFDGKLNWITGLYYFHNEGSQIAEVLALPFFGGRPGTEQVSENGSAADNDSYSAFAQATYALTSSLRLTGGVRYVVDHRRSTWLDHRAPLSDFSGFISCSLANDPGGRDRAGCVLSNSVKYRYAPWTVGLDYRASPDVLIYAKVSKGFRSGAFSFSGPAAGFLPSGAPDAAQNAFAISQAGPVAPERVLSGEAGVKSEWLDRRLRVNAAIYHMTYDNIQNSVLTAPPPGCGTCSIVGVLKNSGDARMYGAELDVSAVVGDMTFDFVGGYVDPKYVKGPYVGTNLLNISKFSGAIGATYRKELTGGKLTVNADYAYRTKIYFGSSLDHPPAAAAAIAQKGYGLLDARASFAFANTPVEIAIYGQNLADKSYYYSGAINPASLGNYVWLVPAPPRTFGASIRYSF
jgi:iron complex outermembrane receptor protein